VRDKNAEFRDLSGRTDKIPQLLLRLEKALEMENQSLQTRSAVDASEHITRKNHALLELQRIIAGLSPEELKVRAGARLQTLRQAVKTNADLLSRQMDAVREVSEILREAIHLSDSDGTYSAHPANRGEAR